MHLLHDTMSLARWMTRILVGSTLLAAAAMQPGSRLTHIQSRGARTGPPHCQQASSSSDDAAALLVRSACHRDVAAAQVLRVLEAVERRTLGLPITEADLDGHFELIFASAAARLPLLDGYMPNREFLAWDFAAGRLDLEIETLPFLPTIKVVGEGLTWDAATQTLSYTVGKKPPSTWSILFMDDQAGVVAARSSVTGLNLIRRLRGGYSATRAARRQERSSRGATRAVMCDASPSYCRSSLVPAAWLRSHLSDDDLLVLDVTQKLDKATNTVSPDAKGFLAERIHGARFADVGGRLSMPGQRNARGDVLHNMRPAAGTLTSGLAELGVRDDARTHLVLYSSRHVMWATRVWWLLHSVGFAGRVSVLDGGLQAWRAHGFETESGPPSDRDAWPCFGLSPPIRSWRAEAFVAKDRVLSAIGNPDVALIDSLKPASFAGTKESRYGRRGHIESAVNVPYTTVVDTASGLFLSADAIGAAFAAVGLSPRRDERTLLLY